MKALRYLGILLITLVALFLILGIVAPKKSHLERSASINAKPETVQNIVARFSESKHWNPFLEKDPNVVVTMEGQDGTVGSKYTWKGNKDVGAGSQTISKLEPGLVETALHFETAMGGDASAAMKIVEENGGTSKATWSFDMISPYPWNAMNLFISMDKLLGPDYEKGLAKLKTYAESIANKKYRGYEVNVMDSKGHSYVGLRKTIAIKDGAKYFKDSEAAITAALNKAGKEMDGMLVGLYYNYDEKAGITDMAVATSVKGGGPIPGLTSFDILAGKDIFVNYYGAYDKTGEAHYAIDDYMKEKGIKNSYPVIESYMTDPMVVKDTAKWHTQIIYPIAK